MDKLFIKNRHNQNISVLVEKPEKPVGLAFVMHGLGSSKDFPHIKALSGCLFKNDFTVVSFDARNTNGKSEGKMEEATISDYYRDLEDVLSWSKNQSWYQEPFYLIGHSLGSFCISFYAQKHPEKVKALAPISLVISGELLFEAWGEEDLRKWKISGLKEWESSAISGLINKVKYGFVPDALKYDLRPEISKLTQPVLMVVGSADTATPVEQQKMFFDQLPGSKEFHIIKGAGHTFSGQKYSQELTEIFDHWLKSLK
jgi:pimeloyl-ACP methyl ester carboxylesterase